VTGTIPGRRIAWFHCFSGIAGDMALGSLLAAGAPLAEVVAMLERLDLDGWRLETEAVLRGGIAATKVHVVVTDDASQRTWRDIAELISSAGLPSRVEDRALAVFARLAHVEAAMHAQAADDVHFHEVGGHDAIIDVVGTAAALELLEVDEIFSSPVATGLGLVTSAHGMLPNPAPAVVGLLEDIPTWGRDIDRELTTPTGAALLAAMASGFGPMPAMRVLGHGFGAGGRELDELPNCTQVVLGVATGANEGRIVRGQSPLGASPEPGEAGQPVIELQANLDDVTGEQLAHAVTVLLEAGAHDAWLVPVLMKKGRPGHVLHVLSDVAQAARLREVIRTTTGTLGVRAVPGERWPLARRFDSVKVDGFPIAIKVGAGRIKAEHDDVAAVARRTGRPLRSVADEAESAWRAAHGPT